MCALLSLFCLLSDSFHFLFPRLCLLPPLYHAFFHTLSRAYLLSLPSSVNLFFFSFHFHPSLPLLPLIISLSSPLASHSSYQGISRGCGATSSSYLLQCLHHISLSPLVNRALSEGSERGRQFVCSRMLILSDTVGTI